MNRPGWNRATIGAMILAAVLASVSGPAFAGEDADRGTEAAEKPAASAPAPQQAERPPLESLAPSQWSADLDELVAILTHRHIDPFGKITRDEFDAAVVELKARLPGMPANRVLVEIAKLGAMVGDPHTTAALDQFNARFATLPVRMARLDEGVVVVGTTEEHGALLGAEVLSINDVPITEVANRVASVAASDNQWGARQRFAFLAHFVDLLAALEIAPAEGPIVMRLRTTTAPVAPSAAPPPAAPPPAAPPRAQDPAAGTINEPVTVSLAPLAPGTQVRFLSVLNPSAHANPPISWRGNRANYWFEAVPDEETVYFNYSRCIDNPGNRFEAVANEAMQAMAGMKQPRIIIDLRQNGGGDSRVIEPLITALANDPRFAKPGAVVALIAPRTQSSAAMNAVALKSRANATLIGEPTGQRPNHLGEMRTFNLPNSGAVVSVSTKRFRQVTGDPDAIMPDITVPVRIADIVAGRDAALEHAIALAREE